MLIFISFLAGAAAGSFSNVCILRLPKNQSLWSPRSHCPQCRRRLRIVDNIPIFSFLILKGHCYYCQNPISWQYPFIEVIMTALFVFHAIWFPDFLGRMIVADILGFYLLTLSVIDYRHHIIPDELSLSMLTLGLMGSFANPYFSGVLWFKFAQSLAASLVGGLLMLVMAWGGEKAFKKEALGGGDIKLIAACAAVLGWSGIAGPLLIGSLSGGFVALALLLSKKKKLGETLPFGPFLSLGAYLTCLFPHWCAIFIGQR
jgi:leader peptidase (prepilin peptidase) / N-methyltransferase